MPEEAGSFVLEVVPSLFLDKFRDGSSPDGLRNENPKSVIGADTGLNFVFRQLRRFSRCCFRLARIISRLVSRLCDLPPSSRVQATEKEPYRVKSHKVVFVPLPGYERNGGVLRVLGLQRRPQAFRCPNTRKSYIQRNLPLCVGIVPP
jgi:hypothetical protein